MAVVAGRARLVDVRLLADADLAADGLEAALLHERAHGEKIVAEVGQPVAVVVLRLVVHELVLEQVRQRLARAAVSAARALARFARGRQRCGGGGRGAAASLLGL